MVFNIKDQTEEMSKAEKKFVLKASYCDYNRIWKCRHPKQKGLKCTKICKHYQNTSI